MKRLLLLLIALVAVAGLTTAHAAQQAPPRKTTICHKTSSTKNPYVKLTVAKAALAAHARHAGDIIPAPPGRCPGTLLTPDAGGTLLSGRLTGAAEVPGPGDPDGSGTAAIRLRVGQGQICFKLTVSAITLPATGAHIHAAPAGQAGDIVVTLQPPDATGSSSGCVNTARDLVAKILQNPAGYYVNVHTTDFPAGAVRGQLS